MYYTYMYSILHIYVYVMSLPQSLPNCQATHLYSNGAHRFSGLNDTTCHTLEISTGGESMEVITCKSVEMVRFESYKYT